MFPRGRSSVYDYKLCVLLCFVNYGTSHVGASALCTEIGVSSVLQGDFLQKHRALLGVWGFVGGSIPEDSISSVYCV